MNAASSMAWGISLNQPLVDGGILCCRRGRLFAACWSAAGGRLVGSVRRPPSLIDDGAVVDGVHIKRPRPRLRAELAFDVFALLERRKNPPKDSVSSSPPPVTWKLPPPSTMYAFRSSASRATLLVELQAQSNTYSAVLQSSTVLAASSIQQSSRSRSVWVIGTRTQTRVTVHRSPVAIQCTLICCAHK